MPDPLNTPFLGPNTPGPGTYSIPSSLDETVSHSISGRPRGQRDRESTPGAGSYSVRIGAVTPRSPSFSISGRTEPRTGAGQNGVGPGQYTPRDVVTAPVATLKGRARPPDVDNASPGPKYMLPKDEVAPAFSLAGRGEGRRARRSDGPGPANVNLRRDILNNEAPRISFGGGTLRGQENTTVSDSPGPGAYNTRTSVPMSKVGSMGRPPRRGDPRSMAKKDTSGPGPGSYSLPSMSDNGLAKGRTTSFGRPRDSGSGGNHGRRRSSGAGGGAGAGSGSQDGSRANSRRGSQASRASSNAARAQGGGTGGSKIGRGRLSFVMNTASPGPGAYNTREEVNLRTGKTMGKKFADPAVKSVTPAPGVYNPVDSLCANAAPKVTMSPRLRSELELKANNVPGPGTYESKPAIGEGARYSFGGKELPPASIADSAAVGPGSYTIKNPDLGSAPVLKGKWRADRVEDRSPGPLAYTPAEPQISKGGPRLDSSRPSIYDTVGNGTKK